MISTKQDCGWWRTAAVSAALFLSLGMACRDKTESGESNSKPASQAIEHGRSSAGEAQLTISGELQSLIGLKTSVMEAMTHQPETVAFGRLEEDPSGVFNLRAPYAGALRNDGRHEWPRLGQEIDEGQVIGRLEPRLGPVEKVDLSARLANAHAEADEAMAARDAAKASYESKKELNAKNKIVSDRALEETVAALKREEARLTAANEIVAMIRAYVHDDAVLPSISLVCRGGEVVECLCSPDESVEAGQVILRTARDDRFIARIDVPLTETVTTDIKHARIVAAGHEDRPMAGQFVGLAAANEGRGVSQAVLFAVQPDGLPVRPGAPVSAFLPSGGEPMHGVGAPRDAVVRYLGTTWVYVQTGPEQFVRRRIDTQHPTAAGFFVEKGLSAGERVVTTGAHVLLSEELKAFIEKEDEEEEAEKKEE